MSGSSTAGRVSVVLPVYNGERFLAEAIKSVSDQDYRPIEIIVVDDGSTDGSARIARSFGDRVRYVYQPNAGAAARNAGVALCRGELVAFQDADDVWAPGKLSAQVACLLERPELGYVLTVGENFVEDGGEIPAWLGEELFAKPSPHFTSSLVVRKPAFYRVGGFDTAYAICEDVDWFVRANDAGVRGFTVPETLLYRRIHDANLCLRTRGLQQEALLKIARRTLARRREIGG